MLRDEAVAIIHRKLSFRSGQEANAVAALKQAQDELESGTTLPDFLRQEAALELTSGVRLLTLPEGFIRETEDGAPRYIVEGSLATTWLPRVAWHFGQERWGYYEPGAPKGYAIRGEEMYLWPEPGQDYSLLWEYYKKDTPLTENTENGWLRHYPYLMIAAAGYLLAQDLRDQGAMSAMEAEYTRWNGRMLRDVALRAEGPLQRAMGDEL